MIECKCELPLRHAFIKAPVLADRSGRGSVFFGGTHLLACLSLLPLSGRCSPPNPMFMRIAISYNVPMGLGGIQKGYLLEKNSYSGLGDFFFSFFFLAWEIFDFVFHVCLFLSKQLICY